MSVTHVVTGYKTPNVALQARAACVPSSWSRLSNGNCNALAKKLGGKVRIVRPCEHMVSNRKAFELLDVSKRAKNGPVELGGEIDLPGRAVVDRAVMRGENIHH